jgi:AcrR family transcriptional regulator
MTDLALRPDELEPEGDGAESAESAESESKGERTRRRLLEIAIRQFGTYGFRQTSVTDITREAGLTQAACYAYFGSKADLFRVAVDEDAADLIREAAAQAAEHEPRQLLPALVLFLGGALERHPLTARVLQGRETDAVRQLIDLPAVHEVGHLIADAIRRGQETGEVRADIDPDAVGAGAEAIALGLTMSLAMGGGATTQRHAFGVVSAFDAMLKPPG